MAFGLSFGHQTEVLLLETLEEAAWQSISTSLKTDDCLLTDWVCL